MAEDVRVRFAGEPEDLLRDIKRIEEQYEELTRRFVELAKQQDFDPTSQDARELRAEIARTGDELVETGRKGAAAMERVGSESDEAGVDVKQLNAKVDQLERELKDAGRQADRFGKKAGKSTKGIAAGFAKAKIAAAGFAAFLAGGILTRAIRKIAEVTATQARADRQLALAIEGVADNTRIHIDVLKKQASGLQEVTTFGDEAIQGVQNLLLRFAALNDPELLGQATETVLDMASVLEGGLQGSAQQVAKSLALLKGGSAEVSQALTNLRRVGIILSAEQQDRIRNYAAEGRAMEAQQALLDLLSKKFEGAARASREDLAGAFQAVKNAAGDLLEQVGEAGLGDALVSVAKRLEAAAINGGEAAAAIGGFARTVADAVSILADTFVAGGETIAATLEPLRQDIDAIRLALEAAGEMAAAFKIPVADKDVFRLNSLAAVLEQVRKSLNLIGGGVLGDVFAKLALRGVAEELEKNTAEARVKLDGLLARYEEAGTQVPVWVERWAESQGLATEAIEETRAAIEAAGKAQVDWSGKVQDALAAWQAKIDELRLARREAAAEATEAARLEIAAVGDLSEATDQQLDAVKKAVEAAVEAWGAYGEEVPEEIQRVVDELEQQNTLIKEIGESARDAAASVTSWLESFDVATANATQLEDLEKRIQGALDAYELLGEDAPPEIRRVADELGVVSTRMQELQDEAAKTREKIAEEFAGLVDELAVTFARLRDSATLDTDDSRQELEALRKERDKLLEKTEGGAIGELADLDRLDEVQSAIREIEAATDDFGDSVKQSKVGIEEVDDAIRKLVESNATAFGRLGDVQRQQIGNILTQLQSFAEQGIASTGAVANAFSQVADVLESAGVDVEGLRDELEATEGGVFDVRGAFAEFGKTATDELAKTVEGWEDLDKAQQSQVKGVRAVEEEVRKSLERTTERISEAAVVWGEAWDVFITKCEEAERCADKLASNF